MTWITDITDLLWRGSWAVVPFALIVAAVCRWAPCRAGTRHTLWVVLLGAFLAPLISLAPPVRDLAPAWASVLAPAVEVVDDAEVWPVYETPAPRAMPVQAPEARSVYFTALPVATALDADDDAERLPAIGGGWFGKALVCVDEDEKAEANVEKDCRKAVDERGKRIALGWRSGTGDHGATFIGNKLSVTKRNQVTAVANEPEAIDGEAVVIAEVEPEEEKSSGGRWAAALLDVREALTRLPALPGGLWIAGAAGLALLYAGGSMRFARRLARSRPAPERVKRMTARLSRKMGLRRAPETVMLDEPVSPMIWLGRRVLLVLPSKLWEQLDDIGRQAILCHELAHLRRRDHWVRWLELLISALLWWNPLIWWVRRRVHEEADLCCDMWVTWLMPRRRRAYAEALLAAREHISEGGLSTPSVAMGAATSNARKFTRRITMVMTQNTRPGLSLAGIGLACSLALAGWIVTPALGGPPKAKASACTVTCEKAGDGEKVIVYEASGAKAACPSIAETVCVAAGGADEPVVFYVSEDGEKKVVKRRIARSKDDLEARLERLERALEKLSLKLEKKSDWAKPGRRTPFVAPAPPVPPTPPAAMKAPQIWVSEDGGLMELKGGDVEFFGLDNKESKNTITELYQLPKGKLDALTALMARDDVPVLITPTDEGIVVRGTKRQQKIFKAFVDMIHPKGAKKVRRGGHTLSTSRSSVTRSDDGAVIRIETSADNDKVKASTIEIKDGVIYIDGEEIGQAETFKSGGGVYIYDDGEDSHVEIKDGTIYINGDEIDLTDAIGFGNVWRQYGNGAQFDFYDAYAKAGDKYAKAMDEYGRAWEALNTVWGEAPEFEIDCEVDVDGEHLSKMIQERLNAAGIYTGKMNEKAKKQMDKQVKVLELNAAHLEKLAEELEEQAEEIEIEVHEVPEL